MLDIVLAYTTYFSVLLKLTDTSQRQTFVFAIKIYDSNVFKRHPHVSLTAYVFLSLVKAVIELIVF